MFERTKALQGSQIDYCRDQLSLGVSKNKNSNNPYVTTRCLGGSPNANTNSSIFSSQKQPEIQKGPDSMVR